MIKFVVDSTSNITKEFAKKHDISFVPLTVILKDKEYKEGYDGEFDEFYTAFENSLDLGITSQPPPEKFEKIFNKILSEGNEVFYLSIAEFLSGTINSAKIAKENCKDPSKVTVVDSQTTSQVIVLILEKLMEMAKNGANREQLLAELPKLMNLSGVYFVPQNLKYLASGGRVNKMIATVGAILNIKPILFFQKNKADIVKKIIGMKRALEDMIKRVPATVKKIVAVKISSNPLYEGFVEDVKKAHPNAEVIKGNIGPVLGKHIGPGTIGLCYME